MYVCSLNMELCALFKFYVSNRTINPGIFHEVLLSRCVHLNVDFSYDLFVYIYICFPFFSECFSDIYVCKFVNLIAFLLYVR